MDIKSISAERWFLPLQSLSNISVPGRDIYKYVDARTDGKAVYLMLGLEVQDKVHYAMPVRTMLYDAME